jgi:hypothetical protein
MIDGRPLHELAPEILTQQIGSTGFYHATVRGLSTGGHVVTSRPGFPISGSVLSGNGDVARDAFTALLPFWMEQVGPDVTAPTASIDPSMPKGTVTAKISDRTPTYFSGVADVRLEESPGWKMISSFITPDPDTDADLMFRAVADPSGPLKVRLSDRDGNDTLVELSAGVCFKTATASRQSVAINMPSNVSAEATLQINASVCGDEADIKSLSPGFGPAAQHLADVFFGEQPGFFTPFTIPANGSATLTIRTKEGVPQGTYHTEMLIGLKDSMLIIPVTLEVGPALSVAVTGEPAVELTPQVFPNPITSSTTIRFERPLPLNASVTLTDGQGRSVRSFDEEMEGAQTSLIWNGDDQSGRPVPAGTYFLTITSNGSRTVQGITVVR